MQENRSSTMIKADPWYFSFPGASNHQADLSANGADWAGTATCLINCHVPPDRQPRRPPYPSLSRPQPHKSCRTHGEPAIGHRRKITEKIPSPSRRRIRRLAKAEKKREKQKRRKARGRRE
ncbi:hypothetical protein PVAP13_5KG706650 [Panicum virgatum]|uniref:Uncharacterized protein n=1 Tax=Panicum virgatum TaxID=38727 RepID=A0A8T0SZG7_PANVG|nr:hypothetical protein PVAP13_5KG706650 [Panicum virgatum]